MATYEAPAWSFDQTGTREEIEAAIRGESFGGNKNAQVAGTTAIDLMDTFTGNGVRVAMKEATTDTGQRYIQLKLVDLNLLLQEGEAQRRQAGREMRP